MSDTSKSRSQLLEEIRLLREENERLKRYDANKNQFEEILDLARELIFQIDTNLNLVFFNKFAEDLTGARSEDWAGQSFAPFVHPDELDHVMKQSYKTLRGESVDYETRILDINHNTLWIRVQAIPSYQDGELSHILCFAQDITARKNTEIELEKTSKRFRQIFENVQVSVWEEDWNEVIAEVLALKKKGITDFKTYFEENPELVNSLLGKVRIDNVNPETLRMFHAKDKTQLIESLETVFSTPDTVPGFIKELVALAEGKQTFKSEMAMNTVDNHRIHVLVSIAFPELRTNNGKVVVSLMDITERKKSEKNLKLSEQKHRSLFENAAVGMFRSAIDGSEFYDVNEKLAEQFETTKEDMLANPSTLRWRSSAHREHIIQQLYEKGEVTNYEVEAVTSRGNIIVVMTSMRIYEEYGYIEGTALDITKRKKAEEDRERALNKMNDRLKELNCVFSLSESVRKRETIEEILYDTAQILPAGWHYSEIARAKVIYDDKEYSYETFEETPYKQSAPIIINGQERGRIEVCYIEERPGADEGPFLKEERKLINNIANTLGEAIEAKLAEKLFEREKRFSETVINSLPGIFYLYDNNSRLKNWNNNLVDVTGYLPDELLDKKPADFLRKKDSNNVNTAIEQVFTEGKSQLEADLVTKHGKEIPHLFTGVMIDLDGDGFFAGVGIDISEKRRAEEKLKKINKELKVANETKDRISSIISHDLRSPFNSILGFLDLLQNEYDEFTEQERKQYLGAVNTTAHNAYELLDNLLAWSYSHADNISFSPVNLNLRSGIDSCMQLFQANAESKEISLKNQVSQSISVSADRYMFNTIIRNLINNALKYTEKGGEVTIHTGVADDSMIRVIVSDTGIGIPPEKVSGLFGDIRNQSTRGTQNEKGTGLGLSICKEFVEEHGGKIWVESTPGEGSDFILTLPLAEGDNEN